MMEKQWKGNIDGLLKGDELKLKTSTAMLYDSLASHKYYFICVPAESSIFLPFSEVLFQHVVCIFFFFFFECELWWQEQQSTLALMGFVKGHSYYMICDKQYYYKLLREPPSPTTDLTSGEAVSVDACTV